MKLTVFGSYNKTSIGDRAILIGLLELLFRVGPDTLHVEVLAFDRAAVVDELRSYTWFNRVSVRQTFTRHSAGEERPRGSAEPDAVPMRQKVANLLPKAFLQTFKIAQSLLRAPKNLPGTSVGLIIGGGNLLMDAYPEWPLRPYLLARRFKKSARPIALLGVGALPLATPFRRIIKMVVDMSDEIYVRDVRSRDALRELAQVDAVVHPDLAFSCLRPPRSPQTQPVLAVNVANVFGSQWPQEDRRRFDGFINDVATQVARVLRECTAVSSVMIFNTNFPGDREASDLLCDRLSALGVAQSAICYEPKTRSVDELIRDLSTCHSAITTRLHAAILTLLAGLPVVPIAYDPKVTHVLRIAKKTVESVSIRELHALKDTFDALVENPTRFSLSKAELDGLDATNEAIARDIMSRFMTLAAGGE